MTWMGSRPDIRLERVGEQYWYTSAAKPCSGEVRAGAKAKNWGEGYPQCLFRIRPSVARACSVGVGAFGLL